GLAQAEVLDETGVLAVGCATAELLDYDVPHPSGNLVAGPSAGLRDREVHLVRHHPAGEVGDGIEVFWKVALEGFGYKRAEIAGDWQRKEGGDPRWDWRVEGGQGCRHASEGHEGDQGCSDPLGPDERWRVRHGQLGRQLLELSAAVGGWDGVPQRRVGYDFLA